MPCSRTALSGSVMRWPPHGLWLLYGCWLPEMRSHSSNGPRSSPALTELGIWSTRCLVDAGEACLFCTQAPAEGSPPQLQQFCRGMLLVTGCSRFFGFWLNCGCQRSVCLQGTEHCSSHVMPAECVCTWPSDKDVRTSYKLASRSRKRLRELCPRLMLGYCYCHVAIVRTQPCWCC